MDGLEIGNRMKEFYENVPTHPTYEKMSRCITNGWQRLQTFYRKLQKALR